MGPIRGTPRPAIVYGVSSEGKQNGTQINARCAWPFPLAADVAESLLLRGRGGSIVRLICQAPMPEALARQPQKPQGIPPSRQIWFSGSGGVPNHKKTSVSTFIGRNNNLTRGETRKSTSWPVLCERPPKGGCVAVHRCAGLPGLMSQPR